MAIQKFKIVRNTFLLFNINNETNTAAIDNAPAALAADKKVPELTFSVYHNPSGGQFMLEADTHTGEKLEIRIYSLTGREVYSVAGTGNILRFVDLSAVKQSTDHVFVAKLVSGGKIYHYKILTP